MAKVVSFSEAASIALHAMILVARAKGTMNVDKIAEITQSSRHHVAKVMQRLAKDGYVGSYRGPKGGFYLSKNAEKISLLEIYECIEGILLPNSCAAEKPICNFEHCIMNNITHELTAQFKNYMAGQMINNFV
jgi:Rrf2 family protein